MYRTVCVLIAAILALPLPVIEASPPDSEPPRGGESSGPEPSSPFRGIILPREQFPYPSDEISQIWRHSVIRPVAPPTAGRGGICLAADPDLCELGARVAHSRPCLASEEDCPAYQAWDRVMGTPGVRPAPESAVRAVEWAPVPVPADPRD